jgi:hypothetical protein
MKNIKTILFLVLTLSIGLGSCVKKKFDPPPYAGDYDPNLPVNMNIKDLKAMYNLGSGGTLTITEDYTISGIVTASDESGNFYKQIIIQDSTAALPIKINQNNLYTEFPVGRKVYVKCKGMSLGEYGDFIQLGYGEDADKNLSDLPRALITEHVIKASYPNVVEPKVVTVGDLNSLALSQDLLGMLVKFERVQIIDIDRGKNYGDNPDVTGLSGVNRTIVDCAEDEILFRNSNYANFRDEPMPDGAGSMVGIYSRFNDDAQILIRDPKDVNFNQERCPFGQSTDTIARIADLRNMYTGTDITLAGTRIRGVVISDPSDDFGNNITSKNMVIQDGDRGIVVRFATSEDNPWAMGDSLEIIVGGQKLNEFGRLLQIGDQVKASDVQKLGTGTVIPRVATIDQIITNFEDWESTLVTIQNALFVSGQNATYQGSIQLNDGSTTTDFPLFTQFYSEFVNVPAPIGQTKNVTGFLYSITSTDRISMRRLTDVTP